MNHVDRKPIKTNLRYSSFSVSKTNELSINPKGWPKRSKLSAKITGPGVITQVNASN